NGPGDDLTIKGTLNFITGLLNKPGNAVVAMGGSLLFDVPLQKLIAADITNNGTVTWQNATIYFYAPNVLFTNAGTFNITGNNTLMNEIGASGKFINTGTITKTSTGLSDFMITEVTNSGTINLNAGTFANRSTLFTNAGNLTFNNGAFINELNRVFDHNGGSVITGSGDFTNNGTMHLNINQAFPSSLEFAVGSSSITTGSGNLTINNDFTMQGEISGSGSLTINANTTWNGGTLKR